MKHPVLRQAFRYNVLLARLASREMWEDHRRVRLAWMQFMSVVYNTDERLYYQALVFADRGYAVGLSSQK